MSNEVEWLYKQALAKITIKYKLSEKHWEEHYITLYSTDKMLCRTMVSLLNVSDGSKLGELVQIMEKCLLSRVVSKKNGTSVVIVVITELMVTFRVEPKLENFA